jgi:glyoxylase-like metal-dependent hydrolase (beta-lactamase superfamily II)
MSEIVPIRFSGLCGNCYLLKEHENFILVDTACRSKRKDLVKGLEQAGCLPGNLRLILLTHGDFDHSGNAAWLVKEYGCPVGIHPRDAKMVEKGRMFITRDAGNLLLDFLTRVLLAVDTFNPDVSLEDGMDLSSYGFGLQVIHVPGHSPGSVAFLTGEGDLICGDLFENRKRPGLYFVDDREAMEKSLEKLKGYSVRYVYPGHGERFHVSQVAHLL